ncbi:MAG: DNA topoisomerase IV subunit A, partial [Alphaproteobacteria bacterium]
IGKYHPHGDTAIYDAMVRLAQGFAQRYTLVDGQGNFGNIDGDNPAAMRYTEARMTMVAQFLLEGLDEDAVDFRPTYDGEDDEPVVLPANFPNLLANGSLGIAVGMATSIPPHNALEICDALVQLIKKPSSSIAELLEHMPGPDFPTGGVLMEDPATILETYETGRGSFRIRAAYEIERFKGGGWQVIINEIPYHVQKSRLIERVAEMVVEKKLHMVGDFRDESSDVVRVVVEPKTRSVDPELMMESLFRQTDLENRFSMNMNVLDKNNVPSVMSLKKVLKNFLDHRFEVLTRRTNFRLGKIERRLHMLEGFLIAYLNIDEVIRIIRFEDHPKAELIRKFELSEEQAEAILNMRLRALNKLEEVEIQREHKELSDERDALQALLADNKLMWKNISIQIKDLKKALTDPKKGKAEAIEIFKRLTRIEGAPKTIDVPLEAMVEKEPITVVLSAKGWVRAIKGHNVVTENIKYKEDDKEGLVVEAHTTDKLLLLATNGRFYTLSGDKLPGGRGFGEPLSLMIDFPNDAKPLQLLTHKADKFYLIASSDGRAFKLPAADLVTNQKAGKQILNVSGKVTAKILREFNGDHIATVGKNRKLLVFTADELPTMSKGKGVILQKLSEGGLSDVISFNLADGLTWRQGPARTKTEMDLGEWMGKRASAGRPVPAGFAKSGKFD